MRHIAVPMLRVFSAPAACLFDVVIIQRRTGLSFSSAWLERWIRVFSKKMIYLMDDGLHLSYPQYTDQLFNMADAVITGNAFSQQDLLERNINCLFVPTGIAPQQSALNRDYAIRGTPIIGWIGTAGNFKYIKTIESTLADLQRKFDFEFQVVSSEPYKPESNLVCTFKPWSKEQEEQYLKSWDIGIMPLVNTPYTQRKEAYKLKQYMASALPSVSSPFDPFAIEAAKNDATKSAETPQQWFDCLSRLLESEDDRTQIGKNGYSYIQSNATTELSVQKLIAIFENWSIRE